MSLKRPRDDIEGTFSITLTGGHAEASRTIAKFESQISCDAVVQTSCGTSFHAHSIVLQGKSDYFEALYGAAGAWSDSQGVLTVQQISATSLASCLDWIYRGQIAVRDDAALRDLLDAAVYLQIPTLVQAATTAMGSSISQSNATEIWCAARRHALAEIEAKALAMMALNFRALVGCETWTSAPMELVKALLADDRLDATHEEDVFSAALTWLRSSSPALAADDILQILRQVRYARMERSFVMDQLCNEPLLAIAGGHEVILAAFQDFAYGLAQQAGPRAGYRQRYIVVLGGHNGITQASDSVERFDVVNRRWDVMPHMTCPRSSCAAAVLNENIYVVGGVTTRGAAGKVISSSTAERFDIVTATWQAIPSMSIRRVAMGMAALNGSLYVVGGTSPGQEVGRSNVVVASAECYTPGASDWRSLPTMATPRQSMGVAALGGKLYVVGGVNRVASGKPTLLSSMERYDPLDGPEGSWSTLPSMKCGREWCSCMVVNDCLIVIHKGAMVEVFDPLSNTWVDAPSTQTQQNKLSAAGSILAGRHVYIAGGFFNNGDGKNQQYLNRCLRFCTTTGHYEEMPAMLSRRQWPACVTY